MGEPLKLMIIFPHPDDESLGMGGTLAKYANEGTQVYLSCLTRGERGWPGLPEDNPGMEALGRQRESELRCACQALGVREVTFLDYIDGDVDKADFSEATDRITAQIRRIQPQVVVTFGPEGVYGHPDHIATSQLTQAAVLRSADASYIDAKNQPPHQVSKLYYLVDTQGLVAIVNQFLGGIQITVDGVQRGHFGYPEWLVTTCIDTSQYLATTWQAILCHQTQLPGLKGILEMPEGARAQVWGQGSFYRVFSLVNGGRTCETDLFEGLRES